jgi:Tfp pilus assembly PilM family ATPase
VATENEVSSTEKLLDVIRKSPGAAGSDPSSGGEAAKRIGEAKPNPGKMGFGLRARAVVGVELLENGLRAVKMVKDGSTWRAEQAVTATLKAPAAFGSDEFIAFVQQTLQRIEGIRNARLWTRMPAGQGEIWQIHVPPVKKDLHQAVFWTAKREKGFNENTTLFDYRILGEATDSGAKKLTVEVFSVSRQDLNNLKKIFNKAGYPLAGITLSSFALANIFAGRCIDPGPDPFAVLAIDEESSTIDIHQQDRLLLNREIKTGLDSMLAAILEDPSHPAPAPQAPSGGPPAPIQQARMMIHRLEEGPFSETGAHPSESDETILAMIHPALERLARQVERTIDHCQNVMGYSAPRQLYLCGRLASAPAVVAFFEEQLGLATLALDPLNPAVAPVAPDIASLDRWEQIALASTAGLAMSRNRITPNFLFTARDRETRKISKRNGAMMGSGLLALAAITGIFLIQGRLALSEAARQVRQIEEKLDARKPLLTIEGINQMAADYRERVATWRSYPPKFLPAAVLSELSAITPPVVQLLNMRLEMNRPEVGQSRFLVLEGIITGEASSFETQLSSYLFRLRNSPLFAETTIESSETVPFESEGQVMRFVINVNLKQVPHEQT